MSKTIKAIKVIKDLPINPLFKKGYIITRKEFLKVYSESEEQSFIDFVEKKLKDYFEIEYKQEPKILKRPDGSVISGLEEGCQICFINEQFFIRYCNYKNYKYLKNLLKQGLVFLPEDQHLAEKKAQMLTKKLEIQFEIDKLNAEEGWVANWWTVQNKYILESESDNIYTKVVTAKNAGQTPMSPNTAKTILAKYSQEELQQYLGKII